MKSAIAITDLSVSFFSHAALRKVSALFPAKRISVLLGRSGSGKTTLLRAVNRLNEEFPGCATRGRVRVDFGEGPREVYAAREQEGIALSELRLRAGMLFQTPNCFPVSVYRNIAMPLALVGGAPDREIPDRVREALHSVGLWKELQDRLDAPAERLSGGQQQRLCLARLLALEPSILLLDEPTASLDVHAAREIEALLQELSARYTVIMVSHELSQARRMADRILVCSKGSLSAVYEHPEELSDAMLTELLDS